MTNNKIQVTRARAGAIEGKQTAEGFAEGPAAEIVEGALYTFEAEIRGQWFRWIDQRPVIVGDRAHFDLRDGVPIDPPTE